MSQTRDHFVGILLAALIHLALLLAWLQGGNRQLPVVAEKNAAPISLSLSQFEVQSDTLDAVDDEAVQASPPEAVLQRHEHLTEVESIPATVPESDTPVPEPIPIKPPVDSGQQTDAPASRVRPQPPPAIDTASLETGSLPAVDSGLANQLEDQYRAALRDAIEKNKHYPRRARQLKREGSVVVRFIIERDGSIRNIEILHSSGMRILDDAALQAVRKTSAFEPFPDAIQREFWRFDLPMHYNLM
jgi:protein TonB